MSRINFTNSSSKKLMNGFRQLEANNIEYLILNTWVDLPNASHGNDVDILISAEDYSSGIEILKNIGFKQGESSHWRITGFAELAKKGLTTHRQDAIEMFLNNHPENLIKKIVNPAYEIDGYDPTMVDRTPLFYENMKLDITNHLNYHTADGSEKMRVNPEAEKHFFETRIKNDFYVASPPCELAHMVCRMVFDYEQKTNGKVPRYYIDRCNDLIKIIEEDDKYDQIFKSVLHQIFFKADELVYQLVMNEEYNNIRSNLIQFSKY